MNNDLVKIKKIEMIILLATYNGERYIEEQLESIMLQSNKNWNLYIRDDMSTDKTLEKIANFAEHDSRVIVISDNNGNVGQCKNFDILMKKARNKSKYVMFADQDDIWYPNKIEMSIDKIKKVEMEVGSIPILVYSNYLVGDSILNNRKLAYDNRNKVNHSQIASRLLVQNWIMGCTVIINQRLLEIGINIPDSADNHDNWLALLSSLVGKIDYINRDTMIHRVHSTNVTTNKDTTKLKFRLKRVVNRFKNNDAFFDNKRRLSKELHDRIKNESNKSNENILLIYIKILESSFIYSLYYSIRYNFKGVNLLQTLLFYLQLLVKGRNKVVER